MAHAGGLRTARLGPSPVPSTATVATWGRRFGANADGRLGLDCRRCTADTCIGFDSFSRGGSSFRIACIRCQISIYRQLSDRRPGVLLPTLYV